MPDLEFRDRWPAPVRPVWMRWLTWRNEWPARRPTEVDPRVWVGGVPSAKRWRALEQGGVTAVVVLTAELSPPVWLRSAGRVLWLPVADRRAPSDRQLTTAADLLDDSVDRDEGVFVCCGAGLGRAPTLWAGWRIARGEPVHQVLARLRAERPIVDPTPHQLEALERWGGAKGYAGQCGR